MQIYMFEKLTHVICHVDSNLSCRYGIAIRKAELDLQGDRQGEIMSPQINCQGLSKLAHQSNDKKNHIKARAIT